MITRDAWNVRCQQTSAAKSYLTNVPTGQPFWCTSSHSPPGRWGERDYGPYDLAKLVGAFFSSDAPFKLSGAAATSCCWSTLALLHSTSLQLDHPLGFLTTLVSARKGLFGHVRWQDGSVPFGHADCLPPRAPMVHPSLCPTSLCHNLPLGCTHSTLSSPHPGQPAPHPLLDQPLACPALSLPFPVLMQLLACQTLSLYCSPPALP
jgi:hypothetical protein